MFGIGVGKAVEGDATVGDVGAGVAIVGDGGLVDGFDGGLVLGCRPF